MAYLALSTANLPDPVIDPAQGASPEDYFGTLTWTGTGGSRTIAEGQSGVSGDVNFTPDFCWIKSRSLAASHTLYDAVRTAGKKLASDNTSAEVSNSAYGYLSSFTTGGFGVTTGTDGANPDFYTNESSATYVAWNWKANGSGVSNNAGSIPSTVSANTTSGFSICTFTDAGSAGTVGHGLGVKPDLIIQKPRSGTNDWYVFTEVIDGSFDFLNLNTTGAKNNSTLSAPTSTVFSNLQISGDTVAYCFHSVDGFSKFGSYVGNGSTDGPFVYTGFRPAFVMFKNTTTAGTLWIMFDAERDTYNVVDTYLQAQASSAEASFPFLDLVSNGFKHRHTSSHTNTSGNTYIYMAFAENPFKYSNAR